MEGTQRCQCPVLVPQSRCAGVSGTMACCQPGVGGARPDRTGAGLLCFTCSDALPVQLPLYARGWHPRHSRGGMEEKGKNWRRGGGKGIGGQRRGGERRAAKGKVDKVSDFGLRLPANLEPTPTPSRNKRASARLSVRVRNS